MQVPIVNGIYTDGDADVRTSYPVNMVPVPKSNGVSNGYLRPAEGIDELGTGPGASRGGINWNGATYRVMGSKLVRIYANGSHTILGDVGGGGQVTLDYSFDRLAIASGGNLYYWNGASLLQVTDADLGTAIDVTWIDGYFMTTDGMSLVVTELNDPLSVNPLKYGSSEVDPDPIKAVKRLRNELAAINRFTIEYFDNIGGDFFPFQLITGAQVQKGSLGTHCVCVFLDALAFIGSGRNESPAVYLAASGSAAKISTREIDEILQTYSESELSACVVESRTDKNHQHLWIHLPDRTIVYDAAASRAISEPVWFTLTSTLTPDSFSKYRAKDLVWCFDRWLVGDSNSSAHGALSKEHSYQWGSSARWEFSTAIIYNEGMGAILHEVELVTLAGRSQFGTNPRISTSYSLDGMSWSMDKWARIGKLGERNKRIVWLQQGTIGHFRMQRFRGDSMSFASFLRLNVRPEALAF